MSDAANGTTNATTDSGTPSRRADSIIAGMVAMVERDENASACAGRQRAGQLSEGHPAQDHRHRIDDEGQRGDGEQRRRPGQ
jgi:hypothetical protein